jgi:hypothetical protein
VDNFERQNSSRIFEEVSDLMSEWEFEQVLLAVWDQALVQQAKTVTVLGDTFPVRTTQKAKLKQIDFRFDGRDIRGLEQNPSTKSRWAAMTRKGSKVMQFLEQGRYVAVVVDGKLHTYARADSSSE